MRTMRVPGQVVVTFPVAPDPGMSVDPAVLSPGRDLLDRYGTTAAAIALVVGGAIALVVGWYGIASRTVLVYQLPYLVSGGLAGTALVIAGVVLLALTKITRAIDEARDVLVAALAATSPTSGQVVDDRDVVAAATGTAYHRPACRLAAGRAHRRLRERDAVAEGLRPCLVCHRPDGRPPLGPRAAPGGPV